MTRFIAGIVFLTYCLALGAKPQVITLAQEPREAYSRDTYLYQLLQEAFVAADFPVKFEFQAVHQHQQRVFLAMSQGKSEIDINWSMTSPEREQLLIPIRIPLYKGLIGWRVAVLSREQEELFKLVNSLEQLKRFMPVQGHDWPDTNILARNEIAVKPHANYQAMFMLVKRGLADYFPRSVIEIESEMDVFSDKQLVIDANLLITYPTAFYFFVSPQHPRLAEALQKGLDKLVDSGQFDRIFEQYFGEYLANLELENRTRIELSNPFFPETAPQDMKYWYQIKSVPQDKQKNRH